MTNLEILKRLYNDYTKTFIIKIFLAVIFSILVAGSTSATAWLLDPAIEKIFINKDQTLIFVIPILIILAFSTKGISLYLAKVIMINVAEEVKKKYKLICFLLLLKQIQSRSKINILESTFQI